VASGNFSKPKVNEIVMAKGKVLEMVRPDDLTGKLNLVSRQEVFGLIRHIETFRLLGMARDFLVVASDSGRIIILEYNVKKGIF
jgi:splicing factor 3B subunit 3